MGTTAREGFVDHLGHQIWFHDTGADGAGGRAPLLMLHGGPGGTSALLSPLDALSAAGYRVVRFDQLGSGLSDRPREAALWGIDGTIAQLESVRRALDLGKVHLLGHSWGAMVAIEYLARDPRGVQSALLCSGLASVSLWVEECRRLCQQLPPYVGRGLARCERSLRPREPPAAGALASTRMTAGQVASRAGILRRSFRLLASSQAARFAALLSHLPPLRAAAYEILGAQFVRRHVFRRADAPVEAYHFIAGMNREVYEVLWGPSEFLANGFLHEWDATARLRRIQVPTLVLSGEHDTSTERQVAVLRDGIPGAQAVILEDCSHCGMWEAPDAYRAAVAGFLRAVEATAV